MSRGELAAEDGEGAPRPSGLEEDAAGGADEDTGDEEGRELFPFSADLFLTILSEQERNLIHITLFHF